jgi:hypothetical protein
MEKASAKRERERGWALMKVQDPESLGECLEGLDQTLYFGDTESEQDYGFIVVRTDVVEGEYDLAVSIDAANGTEFRSALVMLEKAIEPIEISILKVKRHWPSPPHMADGFITPAEAEAYTPNRLQIGRQRSSPGANPWG